MSDGGARVTVVLIAINVAMWVGELVLGSSFIQRFAFISGYRGLEGTFAGGAWYQAITSAFLHNSPSPLHIAVNMYALWIVGPYLEGLLGRGRFLALYLLSALGGSLGVLLLRPPVVNGQLTSSLGASGAIFGLFGAWAVVNRRLNRDTTQVLVLIAINAVFGFVVANVAWQAHLGGLITGGIVAAVLVYAPRQQRTPVQLAGLSVMGVLLLAGLVLGVSALPSVG